MTSFASWGRVASKTTVGAEEAPPATARDAASSRRPRSRPASTTVRQPPATRASISDEAMSDVPPSTTTVCGRPNASNTGRFFLRPHMVDPQPPR